MPSYPERKVLGSHDAHFFATHLAPERPLRVVRYDARVGDEGSSPGFLAGVLRRDTNPSGERRRVMTAYGRAGLTYTALVTRTLVERRSAWLLLMLGPYLPAPFVRSKALLFVAFQVVLSLVGFAVLGCVFVGVLRVAAPQLVLGAAFGVLLASGVVVGTITAERTLAPPDAERLLVAPISDRRAHALAFWGAGALSLVNNLIAPSLVVGVSALAVLGAGLWLPGLSAAVFLSLCYGLALALVSDTMLVRLRVRRTARGSRGASVLACLLWVPAALACGATAAGAILPWLATAPWRTLFGADSATVAADLGGWLASLPGHLAGALEGVLNPLAWLAAHPASPTGSLAALALGDPRAVPVCAGWAAALGLAVALSGPGSGGWYRTDWRTTFGDASGRRRPGDLFEAAEVLYVWIAGLVRPGDPLVQTQIKSLCRRREWASGGAMSLFGGPLVWLWFGFAVGAAPYVEGPFAMALFALFVGERAASEVARGAFDDFKETLALDAEGRLTGPYRISGTGSFALYRAKLWAGRIVCGPAVAATLGMIALAAGLGWREGLLLVCAGLCGAVTLGHLEMMPGLLSPHLDWDHPSELRDYYEQKKIRGAADQLSSVLLVAEVALTLAALGGWIPAQVFAPVASAAMLLIAACVELSMGRIARNVTRCFADRMDLCS